MKTNDPALVKRLSGTLALATATLSLGFFAAACQQTTITSTNSETIANSIGAGSERVTNVQASTQAL
ncbi:amino acid ABC transporter substrate-binding protein, partial [Chroococcidiopsis cubana CCALA 043]